MLAACRPSSRQRQLHRIESLEQIINKDAEAGEINTGHLVQAADAMKEFVSAFPEDTAHGMEFRYKAAMLYGQAGEWEASIGMIDTFLALYPESTSCPELLFFKGFNVYEQGMGDLEMARKTYLEFLDKYPDHSLVASVLFSLENLGKSDEEVLEEILQKHEEEGDDSTQP